MQVVALLALLPLLAPPAQDQDEDEGPDPEVVARAVAALEAAYAADDPAKREEALAEHRVPAPEVVALLAKGLKDREPRVRRAALEALRYTPHEDALDALHKVWKRDKDLRSDRELGPVLYRAIGQHGETRSLDLLEANLFGDKNPESIRARILAMGNIRDRESVERLLDLVRKAPATRVRPWRDEVRLSLMMLLAVDRGEGLAEWEAYWKDVRDDFEMAEEPPLLPRGLQERWDRFWGIRREMPRGTRREDRGGDRH